MDFNKCIFIGKVKDTPQVFGEGNNLKASFILITNDRQPDSNGQWVDNYIHIPIFVMDSSKVVKVVRPHIVAGQELTIDARYTNWSDGTTQQHGFVMNSVVLGFKPRQDNTGSGGAPQMQAPPV